MLLTKKYSRAAGDLIHEENADAIIVYYPCCSTFGMKFCRGNNKQRWIASSKSKAKKKEKKKGQPQATSTWHGRVNLKTQRIIDQSSQ